MSRIHRALAVILLVLLLAGSLPVMPVAAQTPQPPSDDEVNAIARDLFCPICENTPLDVCPTEACRQWREMIRQMLAEGKSEEQIEQYFVEYYGARVLSVPPAEGINILAYVLPPLAFVTGLAFIYIGFRRWRQLRAASAADDAAERSALETADDTYTARIEAELKKRG